ncbi:TonB-dependent receptor, partial [Streptomyces sp. S9]|nr:TonB-dependent receptor [Streptomyces sp. S9]
AAVAAGRTIRSDNNLPGVPNSGTLLAAQAAYVNSASTTVRGIDLDARQRFDLGSAGRLNLDLQWSHISKFEREEEDGTVFEYAGTHGNCDVTNCIGTPKDKINLGATWEYGNLSLSGVVNYISRFKNVTAEGNPCASRYADGSPAPGGGCRIPSFTTFDLSGRWRAVDGIEVFGSIQNVTDKIAPLDPLTYGAINY